MPSEKDFHELETLFLALGDKTRLRLLAMMAEGPVAVGLLADTLGESQPKVSRHLAYLRKTGLVSTERDGKWVYYGIKPPQNGLRRNMLETVFQSIAEVPVDGNYAYFAEGTDAATQQDQGDNIYVETYMNEGEPEPVTENEEETPYENKEELAYGDEEMVYEKEISYADTAAPAEMDIFLL